MGLFLSGDGHFMSKLGKKRLFMQCIIISVLFVFRFLVIEVKWK